jgi:hypothetical protein
MKSISEITRDALVDMRSDEEESPPESALTTLPTALARYRLPALPKDASRKPHPLNPHEID